MPQQKQVVIIGAGIGGLSCAARLAATGIGVTIIEQRRSAGGKLGLLLQDGYTWDTGPSLFTQPYLLEELFRDCGKALPDYFAYIQLVTGTQYFWEDGTRLHASPDRAELAREIEASLDIPAAPFLKYLNSAKDLYRYIGTMFLDQPIHRLHAWKLSGIARAVGALKGAYLIRSLHAYNVAMVKHPKLVQLLDRMATYNGSDPYQCPAMLSMIAHLELNEGCWFPHGGMISIPAALQGLCLDLGVDFVTEQRAVSISARPRVAGVLLDDGRLIEGDAVVSNADVFYTYRDLLDDKQLAKKTASQERSSSGIIFYWGIDRSFDQLKLHNIFFGEDYKAEFESIFHEKSVHNDPTVYINISAKVEPGHAPDGCENWFVLINAPAQEGALTPEALVAVRKNVLEKISRILDVDIAKHIRSEKVLTPTDIDHQTGSYMGALYGTASNTALAAFRRHPNFSKKYPGLFFAGGTVHPGGGIPLCLRSGRLAAAEVTGFLG